MSTSGTMAEPPLAAEPLKPNVIMANMELEKAFCSAMSSKNVDGVMACLLNSPDLVVVLYGKVLRGPEQVRGELRVLFDKMRALTLEVDAVKYIACGEAVIAVGTATYQFYPRNGPASTLVERWTDVRRCIQGRWVTVLDHAEKLPERLL